MNKILSLVMVALALVAAGAWAGDDTSTEQENAYLALVLKHADSEGGYTVVAPQTGLSHVQRGDEQQTRQSKQYIVEQFAKSGAEVSKDAVAALVDRLFERNKKSVRLSLKSSPGDGYIIDDGEYEKYFQDGGGGWEKWHKERPQAHGYTTVSIPVYDEKSGLLMLYIGTQSDWLAGAGWVMLFRYENGSLHAIGRVMMWIS